MKKQPRVAVILGSKSDAPHLEGCLEYLKKFGLDSELLVMSAHRQPEAVAAFAAGAAAAGFEVIIAAAGMAAHLPGVVASRTTLPVIGVPVPSPHLNGLDSLLAIVQMPSGVPVATVTLGKAGGINAAILAAQILALKYQAIAKRLRAYKKSLAE